MRSRFLLFAALLCFSSLSPPAIAGAQIDMAAIARQATKAKSHADTLEQKVTPSATRYCALKPSTTLNYMRTSLCIYYPRTIAGLRSSIDSLRALLAAKAPPPPPPPVAQTATLDLHAPLQSIAIAQTMQLEAVPKSAAGVVLSSAIAWSIAPTSVATISGTGLVRGVSAGTFTVTARADTVATSRVFTVTAATPPPPPVVDSTPQKDTTTLPQPPPDGASIAAQPSGIPTPNYPACTTIVRLIAGTDLQAAINSAQGGTCILLAQGAAWVRNYSLPDRSSAGYVTITTEGFSATPGQRMTPTRAFAQNLAKIQSPNYTEAIGTASGAHGYIFRGVEISTTPAAQLTSMNVLVRLTDPTNVAAPRDIQFQQVYVHGTSTLDMRRAFRADGDSIVLVDSYVDDIHSNNSDSQAWLGLNCAAHQLVQNNTLRAGHEIVMFGGGDPSSRACIPHDIVLRWNHIMHPLAWYKVWQVKNCIETKNVIVYLIEGNVIENCWPDAQAGFAFVLKSENQDCGPIGQYSTTSDVTIRYNLIIGAGNGFNLSGKGSNPCPNITSARYDIRHNVFKNFTRSQAIEVQLLSQITDVQLQRNTFLGMDAGGSAFSMDGGGGVAAVRLVVKNTALHANAYGVKGSGLTAGTVSLAALAPGYVWSDNFLAGASSCGNYPATTTCALNFPALPTSLFGADTALVNKMTAGVVVNDPLVLARARTAIPRSALRYVWKDSPAACKVVGKPLPAACDRGVQP